MRVAELAASMLWAAPIVALLVLPAAAALGINIESNPQQVAYLYGMGLLGNLGRPDPEQALREPVARHVHRGG